MKITILDKEGRTLSEECTAIQLSHKKLIVNFPSMEKTHTIYDTDCLQMVIVTD